jgi:hypothetical protein
MSERNPNAAANIPLGAFVMLAVTYFVVMAGLALATAHDGIARFIWVIATLGIVPIFYLPYRMLKGDPGYARSTMDELMENGINTEQGHATGCAALIQMMVVPVCVWVFLLGIILFA